MSKRDLNLKSEWIDPETVRVTWVDVKIRERDLSSGLLIVGVGLGGFFFAAFLAISSGNFIGLLLWLGALITMVVVGSKNYEQPNSITIGKNIIRHQENEFSTDQITRFEMGTEMALLGGVKTKPFVGEQGKDHEANQFLIRMWVDDAHAYDLSKNNWQQQVNHEIRDALSKALEAVRDIDQKQEHEEKFGIVDDSGMPDY